MMHRAWSSRVEVPYCFSRSFVKFQGHTALKIVESDPNWAFPDCHSSLNSPMAMKCCTKLETAKERCPIVFQGHPSNFKVTRDKTSPILTQIGRFRTIGRSHLSSPADSPCFFSSVIEVPGQSTFNHSPGKVAILAPSFHFLLTSVWYSNPWRHSADSSIKLSDLHTTQTPAGEVICTLQWSLSGRQHVCISNSQEDITQTTKENLKWKKFPTSAILVLLTPFKFRPTWIFLKILYVSIKW